MEVHRHEQEHERLLSDLEKLEKQTEVAVQVRHDMTININNNIDSHVVVVYRPEEMSGGKQGGKAGWGTLFPGAVEAVARGARVTCGVQD